MIFDKIKSFFSKRQSSGADDKRHSGVVKRFYYKKGFGFIASPDFDKQIFVHYNDASSKLRAGSKVTFKVTQTEKGLRAIEVQAEK